MAPSRIALQSDRRRIAFSILFCLLSLASFYFLFFLELGYAGDFMVVGYSMAVIYVYIVMIFFPLVASIKVKYFRPTVILFIAYYLSVQYASFLSPFLLVLLVLINALLVAKNLSETPAEKRGINYTKIFIGAVITVVVLFLIIWLLWRA